RGRGSCCPFGRVTDPESSFSHVEQPRTVLGQRLRDSQVVQTHPTDRSGRQAPRQIDSAKSLRLHHPLFSRPQSSYPVFRGYLAVPRRSYAKGCRLAVFWNWGGTWKRQIVALALQRRQPPPEASSLSWPNLILISYLRVMNGRCRFHCQA